ncbi:HTH-like domain-containing protein [Streptomyces sp. 2231.1]|nr:HTH-like domain-containing protein [Streptomyces sp. 2231.1]
MKLRADRLILVDNPSTRSFTSSRTHPSHQLAAEPDRLKKAHWRAPALARAARQAADATLAARIRKVHQDSDGTYGVPRITAELREGSQTLVNHKRVARLMRSIGLTGLRLRRRQRTTVPDPAAVKVPDLIGRDFSAHALNSKYVGDITYLPLMIGVTPLSLQSQTAASRPREVTSCALPSARR